MTTINERFCQVIDDIRQRHTLSLNAIERECGLNKILVNIRNRGIDPSASTMCALAMRFPDYSIDWIITGRGSMLYHSELLMLQKKYQQLLDINLKLQERLQK